MTNVVETGTTEVLVEVVDETTVVEDHVPGLLVSQEVSTETVTSTQTEYIYAVEPETLLLEICERGFPGPPGPPGPPGSTPVYNGKTFSYKSGNLTDVYLYLDAAKTQLAEHRVLTYELGKLFTVTFYDENEILFKTRTLTYSGDTLIEVVDT